MYQKTYIVIVIVPATVFTRTGRRSRSIACLLVSCNSEDPAAWLVGIHGWTRRVACMQDPVSLRGRYPVWYPVLPVCVLATGKTGEDTWEVGMFISMLKDLDTHFVLVDYIGLAVNVLSFFPMKRSDGRLCGTPYSDCKRAGLMGISRARVLLSRRIVAALTEAAVKANLNPIRLMPLLSLSILPCHLLSSFDSRQPLTYAGDTILVSSPLRTYKH